MKQTLLRISIPAGRTLYANQFRELLAKKATTSATLFHYGSDGKPAEGLPAVRTTGGRGWVGILADEEHAELVFDVMGMAVGAVMGYVGEAVRAQIEEHEFGIERLHAPRRYWVREMALKRRHPGSRNASVEDLLARRLTQSIERMAIHYGLDSPTAEELGIVVDVTRHVGMPLSTSAGVTREYVTLANAEFLVHADLKGIWFAGNLTARGYGRIGAVLPGTVPVEMPPARRSVQ